MLQYLKSENFANWISPELADHEIYEVKCAYVFKCEH
jgi:hypothetical protein